MGGTPKVPEIRTITPTLPPTLAPAPTPTPAEITPIKTAEARRKRIAAARYGILSTIKTSPLGIVGAGADLTGGRGKTTLGS